MTFLLLLTVLLGLAVVLAVGVAVVRTVRGDGYGHRQPPPSHLPWAT